MQIMTEEEAREIAQNLVNFVNQTLVKANASPAELAILPEMTKILFSEVNVLHIIKEINPTCGD